MNNEFSITIQYSSEDLQKAYSLHYKKGYPLGSRLLLIIAMISLLFGAGLFIYTYIRFEFMNEFALFLLAYGIVLLAFYLWRFNTMGKRMFKKMPDFSYPYHYRFSEKGMRVESKSVTSDNTWDYFTKSLVTDEMVLLYPNRYRFNFFHRRHFTQEQFAQLQNWVREKCPGASSKI